MLNKILGRLFSERDKVEVCEPTHGFPTLPVVEGTCLDDIVFLSPDPWNPNRWARKQMFAYLLQAYASKVIYSVDHRCSGVENPELVKFSDKFFLYNQAVGREINGANAQEAAYENMMKMLKTVKAHPCFIIAYQASNYRLAKKIAESQYPNCKIIYDLTDDWTNFPGFTEEQIKRRKAEEEQAIAGADIVLSVSKRLFDWGKSINQNTFYLPNATDFELMKTTVEPGDIAPEMAGLKHPVVGYTGRITPWRIDWELLDKIACMEEGPTIVMIGELHRDAIPLRDKLLKRENVIFLGPREYYKLPTFYRGFDVCIFPHSVDLQTGSMDPIKLYDYMGCGRPIVSTAVEEAKKFSDVIRIADDHAQFMTLLRESWNRTDHNPDAQMEVASKNSWRFRVQNLIEIGTAGTSDG